MWVPEQQVSPLLSPRVAITQTIATSGALLLFSISLSAFDLSFFQ